MPKIYHKRSIHLILIPLIFIGLACGLWVYKGRLTNNKLPRISIGNKVTITIEEAKTPDEQAAGLSYRNNLAADHGMLFKFDTPAIHSFWMKGMRFPLDFIWIRNNKIIDLTEHVAAPPLSLSDDQLPTYKPKSDVDEVLEVNAGFVEFYKIKIGDPVVSK